MSFRPPDSERTVICDSSGLVNAGQDQVSTPQIVVVEGPEIGRSLSLTSDNTTIGRDGESEFVLDAPAVSRRHAAIQHVAGTYSVSDLGAANGVFVNGRRLAASETLRLFHGDSILLGTVRLLFVDPITATRRAPSGDQEQTRRKHEADDWIKRIYAIDPLAEHDV